MDNLQQTKHPRRSSKGMFEWYIEIVTKKYLRFDGRASRAEFWLFTLANFFVALALSVIDLILMLSGGFEIMTTTYDIIVFIPTLALCFRRLHDTGNSGWLIGIPYLAFFGFMMIALPKILTPIDELSLPDINLDNLYFPFIIIMGYVCFLFYLLMKRGSKNRNKYGIPPLE